VALVVSMGGMLEWYDFAVFGFVAEELGESFFPPGNKTLKLIETFGVFGGAFIMRPLGGIVFGKMGDKGGGSAESRQNALESAILLMALPTLLMGILPTYHTIGWLAPIAVILIRFSQAFAVGGQLVGAIVYASENAPPARRALYTSVALAGANSGSLLGAIVGETVRLVFGPELMKAWAWRVPFIIGFCISVFAYLIQRGLRKDPEEGEEEHIEPEEAPGAPADDSGCCGLISQFPIQILAVLGVYGVYCGTFYMFYFFEPTYLGLDKECETSYINQTLSNQTVTQCALDGYDKRGTFAFNLLGLAILIFGSPPVAYYVDKMDDSAADADETQEPQREPGTARLLCILTSYTGSQRQWRRFQGLCLASLIYCIAAPFIMAIKLYMGWFGVFVGQLFESITQTLVGGCISAWMVGLFPKAKVYSCIALGLNGATVIFGGSAPAICIALSTLHVVLPSMFLTVTCVCGMVGAVLVANQPSVFEHTGQQHIELEEVEELTTDMDDYSKVEPGIRGVVPGQDV